MTSPRKPCPLHILLTVLKTTGPDSKLFIKPLFKTESQSQSPTPLLLRLESGSIMIL